MLSKTITKKKKTTGSLSINLLKHHTCTIRVVQEQCKKRREIGEENLHIRYIYISSNCMLEISSNLRTAIGSDPCMTQILLVITFLHLAVNSSSGVQTHTGGTFGTPWRCSSTNTLSTDGGFSPNGSGCQGFDNTSPIAASMLSFD